MDEQNILIIGGSGFVSSTIVHKALSIGHKVWTLTRGNNQLPNGVISLIADRKDHKTLKDTINKSDTYWDLVVDCICYDQEDAKIDIDIFSDKAKHLIFISTDFVYNPVKKRFPQTEESDFYLSEGYGGNKRKCELEFLNTDTDNMQWSIVRPCHIYGPGSQLGCLPAHSRDPQLITKLKAGQSLNLVGGGYFLQQPIFADDLAQTILSMSGNSACYSQIFNIAGSEIIESRQYYCIIADILGVKPIFMEIPVDSYLREHPEAAPFLCHRIYDLRKLKESGILMPQKPIKEGLFKHVMSLL